MSILRTRRLSALAALAAACAFITPVQACNFGPIRVHFASGSTALDAEGRSGLDLYADLLPQFPGARVMRLTSHTDTAGPTGANLRLGQMRAEAVRAYLIRKGVPPARIQIENLGEGRASIALGDGKTARKHRFVQVDILTAAEARKGRQARLGQSACRG